MTRAAAAVAEAKTFGHQSFWKVTRLQPLRLPSISLDAIAPLVCISVYRARPISCLSFGKVVLTKGGRLDVEHGRPVT